MKLVCIADAHVHPWRLQSRDGGHDRLMDGLSVIRQSLELAASLGAVWVFAGDMKQPKTSWPQSALTGLHAIFRELSSVPKVMVCGNHDAMGEGGSGLASFKDVATIVETAQIVTPVEDLELICAPWNADLERVRFLLPAAGPRIVIAHGFLQGCMLGPEDTRIAKGIPIADYGKFDLAVFGDVHKAQWRVPEAIEKGRPATWVEFPVEKTVIPTGSVLYCGSPYAQNWGERNDRAKGALVIDLEAQTAELVPLKAPKYVHLDLDFEKVQKLDDLDRDNFYRVIYTGALCGATDHLKEQGESCRAFQFIHRRGDAQPTQRVALHAGMSMPDILLSYMESCPPSPDLDRKRVYDAISRLAGVTA